MFRLALAIFAFWTATAFAEPQFSYNPNTGNGSSEFCASHMSEVERDALWVRVLQELEFAGYKGQEPVTPDSREYTNGIYFLFIDLADDGFCVMYRDGYQPQIPSIRQDVPQ